ncbi:MAG: ABC transporter permease [Bdellovibrionales bacterium]|nr:ABC transporter permease [Bdellovibrionales bacterium]
MRGFLTAVNKQLSEYTTELGDLFLFLWLSVKLFFQPPYRFNEFVKHMEFITNKSIFIICLTAFFTGMVLSFQIYLGFKVINSENLVGPTVGLGIFRELGPVLTGLIVAARAGGAMAARLGTMRVTEQIDALAVMGIDPKQFLIGPRIMAALVGMPLLSSIFSFVAMVGSYFICVHLLDLDAAIFMDKVKFWLNPIHLNEGLLKATIFGMIFGLICTYKGYNTKGGAKGVGDATNAGVVNSMVLIIVSDFFITKLFRIFVVWFDL